MTNKDYTKSWVYTPKKITIGRGISYGLTDLMGGGWGNIVSGIIFTFVMANGMSPLLAGAITGIGRIVDAIFSLFIGSITDNFHKTSLGKRFGRRHFIFGISILAFAGVFPLFWIHSDNWLYYLFIYCLIEIIIAFILICWETLPTEMTDDYSLRTVLSGSRMIISATGTTFVFFVLFLLKNSNNPNAYLFAGIAYTILFVVGMAISWRFTWERPLTQELLEELDKAPKLSIQKIVKDYFSTFRVKAFRKHLSIYILGYTGKDFFQVVIPTFVVYSLLQGDQTPWLFNAFAFVGIIASFAAAYFMIKVGPRVLYTFAFSLIFITLIGMGLLEVFDIHDEAIAVPLLLGIGIVWHIGRQTMEFTAWNVFPFIPDVDRIMTRDSRAGIFAAVMTFFRKSTGAIATWIAGALLELVKFKSAPNKICSLDSDINNMVYKAQDACVAAGGKWGASTGAQIKEYALHLFSAEPTVEHGITAILVFGTGLFFIFAFIIVQSFRLNRHTHGILRDEIHRLENGGSKSDVTPETKEVVEALTGHAYTDCWPEKIAV